MPFEIVRNDIVNMRVDAIVNTANPKVRIGHGVDAGIHKKAGPRLLEARAAIGSIAVGDAAVTPGFDLDAKYVIHTVGPVWQEGTCGEEALLRQCYDRALALAWENRCESVAFPLISAGTYGFPKSVALQVAISAFSTFLMDHDMQIYLVVFSREAVELSEKLFRAVSSFISDTYVFARELEEHELSADQISDEEDLRAIKAARFRARRLRQSYDVREAESIAHPMAIAGMPVSGMAREDALMQLLRETDAGFSETLLKLIDRTGKKDSEIYRKANVDRRLFSKIRNNPDYQPTKATALAFALALELDLAETRDLIGRAGFTLSHSSYFDIIVEFFIRERNYDVFELNEVLFKFDQPLIGV